ncbi:MAG: hypothetical protein R3Y68_02455 [Rikenellaceae bacterium]
MLKRLIHTLFLALLAVGCIDERNIEIIVPYDLYMQEVNGGDSLQYSITVHTKESLLTNLDISYTNLVDGNVRILSDTVSAKILYVDYTFVAPKYDYNDVPTVLTIRAADDIGNIEMLGLAVNILGGNDELVDNANLSLYSAATGRENGYSFELSEFVCSQLVDAEFVDIYEYVEVLEGDAGGDDISSNLDGEESSEEKLSETLSLEWRSMNGRRLMRLNGFGYETATYNTIVEGYNLVDASDKSDRIEGIEEEDIIFVGSDDSTPIAVIRVNKIYDNEGGEDDYYDISIKSIYTMSDDDVMLEDKQL